jgi:hypothetical protein
MTAKEVSYVVNSSRILQDYDKYISTIFLCPSARTVVLLKYSYVPDCQYHGMTISTAASYLEDLGFKGFLTVIHYTF